MEALSYCVLAFVAVAIATIHSRSACKRDILECIKQERRMRGGNVDQDVWKAFVELEEIIRKEI